ncbi:MAG: Cro/C1-type DNA-binding domain [Cyanobacteria bacterium RYN_339]|nr:Cro/C1-type DNA-binding domain [Cyanobacteria bacterium RYN_339]
MKPAVDAGPSPSVDLLKQALQDRGMRQQELAKRTGLSKDHVSRILLGKVSFPKSRDTLNAIAQALGLDPLIFKEYRQQIQVLPESTRRLVAHLKAQGIAQQEWIRRIPDYSEGHLQLILRGGSPFPKDPETIALFAKAAEASPFLFAEYLPLADWQDRVTAAAELALDKGDLGVFQHLWSKIGHHFQRVEESADSFEEKLMRHFLARSFGTDAATSTGNHELDDALTYLPPLAAYQPEVRELLRRIWERGLSIGEVALAVGEELETVFAVANGQMKLKDGPMRRKLYHLLEVRPEDLA